METTSIVFSPTVKVQEIIDQVDDMYLDEWDIVSVEVGATIVVGKKTHKVIKVYFERENK